MITTTRNYKKGNFFGNLYNFHHSIFSLHSRISEAILFQISFTVNALMNKNHIFTGTNSLHEKQRGITPGPYFQVKISVIKNYLCKITLVKSVVLYQPLRQEASSDFESFFLKLKQAVILYFDLLCTFWPLC